MDYIIAADIDGHCGSTAGVDVELLLNIHNIRMFGVYIAAIGASPRGTIIDF
jgi:hypothetical protein